MRPAGRTTTERSLRLAVCENRPEDMQWLLGALRQAGVLVRHCPVATANELIAALADGGLDVVVWGIDSDRLTLEKVREACAPHATPIVAAVPSLDTHTFQAVREGGADDVCVRGLDELAGRVVWAQAERCQIYRQAVAARQAVKETDRRCDALIEAMTDPVAYLNEGLHIKANASYVKMLGLGSFEDLEGTSLLDFVTPSDAASVKTKIKTLGRGQGNPENLRVGLVSGRTVELVLSSAHYDGEPCLQVTVSSSLDSAAAAAAELPEPLAVGVVAPGAPPPALEEWLRRDATTGLLPRQHVLDALAQASSGAAWLLQIDQQEQALSAVGPQEADRLMAALGRNVAGKVPEGTLLARWSAGTLAALGPPSLDEALVHMLQATIAREFLEVGGKSLTVTISAGGVALGAGIELETAITQMEAALAAALAEGASARFVDPNHEQKASAAQHAEEAEALRVALKENRVVLMYQPVVPLAEAAECYDVHARWAEPAGPEPLLDVANRHGQSESLDRWVVAHALEQLAADPANAPSMSVRLSNEALSSPSFLTYLQRSLEQSGVSGKRLWLEISVAAAASHAKQARDLRDAMAKWGSPLVLGDYTLEPAAFRMTEVLAPAWLRLSASAAEKLGTSSDKQTALRTLQAQAHKAGIKVWVDGVADAYALTALFGLGVDAVQGPFLSPVLHARNYNFAQFGG